MGEIRVTQAASKDADEIFDFIAFERQNPQGATRLFKKIDETLQVLSNNPHMGEYVARLQPNLRRFVVESDYLIFFEPIENGILWLRLIHTKRDISIQYFDQS
ncbi:MAG: type II toxin-antitoxin system RelE/ParE family toxin [Planctomycetota bacterium]